LAELLLLQIAVEFIVAQIGLASMFNVRFGSKADITPGLEALPLYPRKRVKIHPQLLHAYKTMKYLHIISIIKTVIPTIYEICIGRVSQHGKSG
jgi:hypothetical protein